MSKSSGGVYIDSATHKVSLPVDFNGEVCLEDVPALIAELAQLMYEQEHR